MERGDESAPPPNTDPSVKPDDKKGGKKGTGRGKGPIPMPCRKGVWQKESGKKVTKKVAEASEKK